MTMIEHRDASNKLKIDFADIQSKEYSNITVEVVVQFGLTAAGDLTVGLDEKFQSFRKGCDVVGLEWDCWSGYIVSAKTASAEPLAREIGNYIEKKFDS